MMPDTASHFDDTPIKTAESIDEVIAAINRSREAFLNQCRLDYEAFLEILPRLEALEALYGVTPRQSLRK